MTERDDGLGIFADVITGALGVVMFTALFFALRALTSSTGVAGIEVRPEFRAELAQHRLMIAEERRERAKAALPAVTDAPGGRAQGVEAIDSPTPISELALEAARRRDMGRQQVRLTELQILAAAAERARGEYEARQVEATEAFIAAAGFPLAEQATSPTYDAQPFYILLKGDRAYPLYHVRDGMVRRATEHVGWLLYDQGRRMRAFPQTGHGWSAEDTVGRIDTIAVSTAPLGWQVVLLVEADAFGFGRAVVRELKDRHGNVTWRPIKAGDYVTLTVDSLPPL